MPVKIRGGRLAIVPITLLVTIIAGLLITVGLIDGAFAQTGPFGAPRPQAAAPPVGGLLGWIFAKQAEFYRQFSGLIRAAKADGSAAWGLFGLSFLYGIFHAAGPGHGKAMISSYIVANDETLTRGVFLSFASALLQACVAVLLVGIAAALLSATATTMGRAVNVIEIVGARTGHAGAHERPPGYSICPDTGQVRLEARHHHTDCPWVLLYIERWLKAPEQREDGSVVPRPAWM
jgi:high-affinity nickel-transport protein